MAVQSRRIKDIAQALIQTAQEKDSVPEAVRSVHLVALAARTHRRFLAEYADPSVPLDERRHALIETFGKSVHPLVLNALCVLQEAGLLKDFRAFAEAAVDAAHVLAQHHEITVSTAIPLTPDERSDLTALLKAKFGGTQHVHEETDPTVLGGMVVQVGDWTLDASVKGKINRLRQYLSAE